MNTLQFDAILAGLSSLMPAAVISAVIGIVVPLAYGLLRPVEAEPRSKGYLWAVWDAVPFVFLLALIGGLTGQLGGSSRENIIGQVVPALMTLFGGFISYYLGAKRDRSGKVAVNTVAFLLGFFIMFNAAGLLRQTTENFVFCRELFSNADIDEPDERQDREIYWGSYCQSALTAAYY